jgi:hypothetical protein
MSAPCDIQYDRGTTTRPAYVKPDFAGACQVYPKPLDDGREPFFLGYQQAWSADEHIMKLAEKSRQIGWTWTSAHGLARRHALADYTLDTWGTSRDDLQAMLAVQDCKAFADILHAGATDMGMQVLDQRGSSGHVLKFANGTTYYSLSSNPDAQAGKRGNRVGDEFALNKDNRQLYAIMEPGVTWGGFIWLFSTHRGSANYFNTLLQEARHKGNPKRWRVYRVTLQDALDCGFLHKADGKALPDSRRKGPVTPTDLHSAGPDDFARELVEPRMHARPRAVTEGLPGRQYDPDIHPRALHHSQEGLEIGAVAGRHVVQLALDDDVHDRARRIGGDGGSGHDSSCKIGSRATMQDCGQTSGEIRVSGECEGGSPQFSQRFEGFIAGCLHFSNVCRGGRFLERARNEKQRLFDNGEVEADGNGASVQLQAFSVDEPDTIHIRKIRKFASK